MGHCASLSQAGTHCPFTHAGVGAEQPALFVHCEPVDDGWQVPCESQVKPIGHGVEDEHWATHWPLSQTFPGAQSLLYVQTLLDAVHVPFAHT